jgi:hypothetical protein
MGTLAYEDLQEGRGEEPLVPGRRRVAPPPAALALVVGEQGPSRPVELHWRTPVGAIRAPLAIPWT